MIQTARNTRIERSDLSKGMVLHFGSPSRRPAGTWHDLSLNRLHGTLSGSVSWETSGDPRFRWCRDHDGVADQTRVAIPNIQPPFTLAAWFRGGDVETQENAICGFTQGALTHYHALYNRFGRMIARTFDGAIRDARTNPVLQNNVWTLAVGVWGPVNHRISLNGGPLLSSTPNGSIANTDVFAVGVTPDATPVSFFLGQVAHAWLFDWDLTEAEIILLYRAAGRRAGLVGIQRRTRSQTRFQGVVRMALDLSGDFAVIDGKVSIILAGEVINDVVMLQSKQKEGDPSEGAYLHRETTFQLPTTGDLDPKVGDTVAVSGVSYRILDVRQPFLDDYWGLKTRELSITADTDLQDLITLFPAVHTPDAYGSKRTTHPTASDTFASVPGKVQPKPATTEELAAKRGFKKTYWIYVSTELPTLRRGDLVKDQNSKQYTIESWTNRQRIDELSVIVCSTPPGS